MLTRSALAAFVAGSLASCGLDRFHGQAVALGGHDLEGRGDRIYFETSHCTGHPERLATLVLPTDWQGRAVVQGEDGQWRVAPPIEPVWLHGEQHDPPAKLGRTGGEAYPGFTLRTEELDTLLPYQLFWPYAIATDVDERANERLAEGQDTYRVLPVDDDDPYSSQRVLAATTGPAGELRWVELMVLHFEDRRSGTTRAFHETLFRSERLMTGVAFGVALVGGIALTVALFS